MTRTPAVEQLADVFVGGDVVVAGRVVGDQPIRGSLVTSIASSSASALKRALRQPPDDWCS